MKREKADCIITVRLTPTEKEALNQKAESSGTTISRYIKGAIGDIPIIREKDDAKLANLICRLYVLLTERGFEDDEEIMEELNKLCQTLL